MIIDKAPGELTIIPPDPFEEWYADTIKAWPEYDKLAMYALFKSAFTAGEVAGLRKATESLRMTDAAAVKKQAD